LNADFKGLTGATAGTGTSANLNGNIAGALSSTWKANSLTQTRNSNGGAVECALNTIAQTTASTASIDPAATFTVDQAWGGKIQSAIDAAWAGDTVDVVARAYTENVILNKALDLVGLGSGTTTTSFTLNNGASVLPNSQGLTAPMVNVNTGAKIQDGVTLASSGGTVNVGQGTYKENVVLGKSLTVSGAGQGTTTVNGGQTGSVFTINPNVLATLSGMTITNGMAVNGAGINNAGTVNLNGDSSITGNSANIDGGGIENKGVVNLNSGSITGNKANQPTPSGGGIWNSGTINGNTGIVTGNTPDDIKP